MMMIWGLFACTANNAPQRVVCEVISESIVIGNPWRFARDDANVGVSEMWYAPDYDDSQWRDDLPAGMTWETVLGDYDGVGWYRTTITLPDWDAVWLAVSGLDDIGELWINGQSVHQWAQISDRVLLLNVRDYSDVSPVYIAFRVMDMGGDGGLKDAIRIAPEPHLATSPEFYLKWLADTHPTWRTPSWTRGDASVWTMTGALNTTQRALVSNDGAVAPWDSAPIAQVWIQHMQTGALLPIQWHFGLVNDYFPMPQWWSDEYGLSLYGSLIYDAETNSTHWQIKAYNASDVDYHVVVTVLPFAIQRDTAPIYALSVQHHQQVWVNNVPFMTTNTAPDAVGVGRIWDVMDGHIPNRTDLNCIPQGDGALMMRYGLYKQAYQEIQIVFPVSPDVGEFPSTDKPFWKVHSETSVLWRDQINRVMLRLPDKRIQHAALASLGYLQIDDNHNLNMDDRVFISSAFLQAGHADRARVIIGHLFDQQLPNGNLSATQTDNWVWQGQVIFLVTNYYRYTRDLAVLHQYYPAIRLAGEFIRDLRAGYIPDNPSARGLLPSSPQSTNTNQPDYRANLWAIIGLRELGYASDILGEDDSTWAIAEADSINQAILDSATSLLSENLPDLPIASHIPVLDDVLMVYPSNAFRANADFIQRRFQSYFDQWIAPYNGRLIGHDGQFSIAGGLKLAHAFLHLGMEAPFHAVLGYTLSHQTMNGVYAWAGLVNPWGLAQGDMPNMQVAAHLYVLARAMVVWEMDDHIELFRLAPTWWFEDGREVIASDLPTMYGEITIRTTNELTMTETGWRGTLRLSYELLGDMPKGGMIWRLPYAPRHMRTVSGAQFEGGILRVSAPNDVIVMTFGE